MNKLNVSFSLRAFIIYFLILGSLSWYIVNNAIERLNDGMRQSAESVMVDVANLLASEIERSLIIASDQHLTVKPVKNIRAIKINPDSISRLLNKTKQRDIEASIYKILKTKTEFDVYVTDQKGIVVYDSSNKALGQDYSQWRDVRLTLEGSYGARTSFLDPDKTEDNDEKIMVVAAPIKHGNNIIGSISVVKPISSLEGHLKTESTQLTNYALILVIIAIVIGYLFSIWLTKSLEEISAYAQNLALGKKSKQPHFWDKRLDAVSTSVTQLHTQLEGKAYVEDYIHSLTHELKTPITSIRGAAELLQEGMPPEEQHRFIHNIGASNQRMAQLVDKMLSLAKLESQNELLELSDFDLNTVLKRLLEERQAFIDSKGIQLSFPNTTYQVVGDRLLIRQALANLLDNAIAFCPIGNAIIIEFNNQNNNSRQTNFSVDIFNQGDGIPDFAVPRLYERFFSLPSSYQLDSTLTAKSTGLGLSFVSEIMKLHDGSITITNHNKIMTQQTLAGVLATLKWSK